MPEPWHAAEPWPCERRYVDAEGVLWCVRERAVADRAPALYFESPTVVRRVRYYPPDWRDLPTGELEILSLKA
jgi:hypothetical protein